MKKNKLKLTVALSALAVLISALTLPLFISVHGAGLSYGADGIRENLLPDIFKSQIDNYVDSFNYPSLLWDAYYSSQNGAEVAASSVTGFSAYPYVTYEGTRCAEIYCSDYEPGARLGISRAYASPYDLGAAKYFAFAVACPDSTPEEHSYTLQLTLTDADGASFAVSRSFRGGVWNSVMLDVSGFAGLNKISSINISVTRSEVSPGGIITALMKSSAGYSVPDTSFTVYFDCVGISSNEYALLGLDCMSDSWYVDGGTVSAAGTLDLALSGENPFIETYSLGYNDFSGSRAVRMRLVNGTGCKSVTMYYTVPGSGDFSEERSVSCDITNSSDEQTLIFPLAASDAYIEQLRFVFNGNIKGTIRIALITPTEYYTPEAYGGTISSCLVNAAGKDIVIRGTLDAKTVRSYAGKSLYLYELEYWEDVAAIASSAPVAEAEVGSAAFSFTVPIDELNSQIFRKYYIAVASGSDIVAVAGPAYVTNPEQLSQCELEYPSGIGKKGFYPLGADDTLKGVDITAVEVALEKLVTLDTSGLSYMYGGSVFYFDREYVSYLDRMFLRCADAGAAVNIILTLSHPEDIALNRILLPENAGSDAEYYAFNTAGSVQTAYYLSAIDFLCARYSCSEAAQGRAVGIVVGKNAEQMITNYNMGPASLSAFTAAYADALRLCWNAAKLRCASIHVYASLGCDWDRGISADESYIFDTRSVLDNLNAALTAGGDIGWQLAFDPYPKNSVYLACDDLSPGTSYESDRVTAANLNVLISYMTRQTMYINGEYRPIMLLEQSGERAEREGMKLWYSADYAFTFYTLTTPNYSLIESYTVCSEPSYNDTLKYIDTEYSLETTSYALELLGIDDWAKKISLFDGSKCAVRSVYEGELQTQIPSSVKGKSTLFTFESKESGKGWIPGEGLTSVTAGVSVGGTESLLSLQFSENEGDYYRGVTKKLGASLDFSVAPYVGFDVQLAVMPEGVEDAELAVIFCSGSASAAFTRTIKTGEPIKVVCDLSGFADASSVDRIRILLRGVDGTDIGGPTLLVSEINAYSTEYDADYIDKMLNPSDSDAGSDINMNLVWILIGIIVTALTLEIINIMTRRRREMK